MKFEKIGDAYIATIDDPADVRAIDVAPLDVASMLSISVASYRRQVEAQHRDQVGAAYQSATPEDKAAVDAILVKRAAPDAPAEVGGVRAPHTRG